MRIDFDPAKNAKNIMERSLSFEHAAAFDFLSATFLMTSGRIMANSAKSLSVIWTDCIFFASCKFLTASAS
ncbi:hypothetical protein V3O24_12110 [Methylobacter sp. Wu8]|uniref:hypothetical protein n=1 Tax=Methylobacter sp. Wu8 TaxID=3118457 RepID=UPI002F2F17D6